MRSSGIFGLRFLVLLLVTAVLNVAAMVQPLRAAPVELTFAATVNSSIGAPGLPAAGAAIEGRMLFDYDSTAYVSQPCGAGCMNYSYASPYTFFVDLDASQVSSPVWDLTVLDDDTTLFGQPMDVVTLSAKVNAISYVLYLIGPPASFTGVGLPDPAVLEDFWTEGVLRVTNEPLSFQVLLSAAVSDTNVLAVPTNVALASAGAVASASSTDGAGYPVAAVNNNERAGANPGNGGYWNDATPNVLPDSVQIVFNGSKSIDRVVVYSLQDNYLNPTEPTDTQTFSLYGLTSFTVEGRNGANWVLLATVSGNTLVKRMVSFAAYTTDSIRISVTGTTDSWSRITEIEAWGVAAGGLPSTITSLTSSGSPAPVGSGVTFTATVTGNNPTGSVTFTESSNAVCPVGTLGGSPRTASCSPSGFALGAHSIVAHYAGDAGNRPSSSTPLSQVISSTTVPASATFVGTDAATKGNWHGVYGADGYAILNDSTSYPAYAQVTPSGQQSYVWDAQPNTDARALQRATSGRIAACWFSPAPVGNSFSVDINLTDGAAHRVALYLLDWDAIARVTQVDVLDAATQQVLSTQTLQAYSGGVYLLWNLQGHVTLRFTALAGQNAVLSGLFFDAPGSLTTYTVSGTVTTGGNPLPGVSFAAPGNNCTSSNAQGQYSCTVPQGWSGSVTPSSSGYAFTPAARTYSSVAANQTGQNYTATSTVVPNSATFVGTDAVTEGNWHGVYGNDGYAILNDSSSYPAYAQVTPSGQQSYVWDAQPNTDARALQRATTGRIAACWYSPGLVGSSFSVDVNLTDGAVHRVALYLLDWDNNGRVNRVDVLDAATQQVLSTQTLQAFNGGVYLLWNLQGHVVLRFTSTGGSNAVLSGLFFDAPAGLTTYTVSGTVTSGGNPLLGVSFAATGTASCPGASNAQGQYSCTVPQGWSGSVTPSLSGYAFTPATRTYSSVAANQTGQNYTATNVAMTTTTLTTSGSPVLAGTSVTFTATVAGNNPTGSVTFTEGSNAICTAGTLSGSPRIASCSTSSLGVGTHSIVANYGGDAGNAPSSSTPLSQMITAAPNAATFVGTDVATKGNWHGVYGNDGYAILNDSTSYPAYAQVTPSGQQSYVWDAQPNTDARALQRATTGRIAACWYSPGLVGSSFSVDINLTDGAVHRVALYLLDWDNNGRAVRLDVLDAATQQVLSTQTLQSFNGGVYLVWNLQGHVVLRITSTGGSNAVLSGLFFDAPGSLTTYTVSGTVTSSGNPLPGVSFAAPGNSCTSSNPQGQYSCTVPQGWSGSVTPSLSGFAFTPAARTYSSVAANQTAQNYTATNVAMTTTTLGSSGSPVLAGSNVTFTATVTGNNPTGSVTFTEGGNAICTAGALSGSPRIASCSTSSLGGGTHSIVANYAGDVGNAASSSAPLTQVITANGLTLTLSGTVYADNGQPLAGVRFDASAGQFSCLNSDTTGHYFCTVPEGWSGTVTPSLAGYEFTPSQRAYDNVMADDTQDYLGIPQ